MSRLPQSEIHMVHRIGWLRAAVLGANDGLVSTASLRVGVAAAGSGRPQVLIAARAGLVAGAMSMAAGEYVSVSSQTDAGQADLARETKELRDMREAGLDELTRVYVGRGLDDSLARQVAIRLTGKDAVAAHTHDELGISETAMAHPVQAAVVSAVTFAAGAVVPVLVTLLAPADQISLVVAGTALVALAVLGGLGRLCRRGGCHQRRGPRHLLGRAGDGGNRRRGIDFRRRRLARHLPLYHFRVSAGFACARAKPISTASAPYVSDRRSSRKRMRATSR